MFPPEARHADNQTTSANGLCGCRYLKAAIPLIFVCASVSLLIFAYSYSLLRTLWRGFQQWRAAAYVPVEEEDLDSEDEVFVDDEGEESETADSETTLVHSLPQDTKVVFTEDKPAFDWAWVAAEVGLLLGQVGLSIFSIVKGEGWRSIAAAGYIQWAYLLMIALLRFIGTKRTKQLWTHSTIIYILYWPIAFLLLRSAILKGDKLGLDIQIANICLVSGLCLLVLTSRAGNKPVRLVSTNGLEPTRVAFHIEIVLQSGTNGKSAFSRHIQLGGSRYHQGMVKALHSQRCLGLDRGRPSSERAQSFPPSKVDIVRLSYCISLIAQKICQHRLGPDPLL